MLCYAKLGLYLLSGLPTDIGLCLLSQFVRAWMMRSISECLLVWTPLAINHDCGLRCLNIVDDYDELIWGDNFWGTFCVAKLHPGISSFVCSSSCFSYESCTYAHNAEAKAEALLSTHGCRSLFSQGDICEERNGKKRVQCPKSRQIDIFECMQNSSQLEQVKDMGTKNNPWWSSKCRPWSSQSQIQTKNPGQVIDKQGYMETGFYVILLCIGRCTYK